MLEYVVHTYQPDLLLAGMPTTDEFQHQFLGLVSDKLPNGAANPAFDDVKAQIKQRIEQQKMAEFQDGLIKKAKTDYTFSK